MHHGVGLNQIDSFEGSSRDAGSRTRTQFTNRLLFLRHLAIRGGQSKITAPVEGGVKAAFRSSCTKSSLATLMFVESKAAGTM